MECDDCGYVVSGSPRSVRLALADARRFHAAECFLLGAGGEHVRLAMRDERGPVEWRVREAAW